MDEELVRLVPCMKSAGPNAASLLIECRGRTPEVLQVREATRLCDHVIWSSSQP